MYGSVTAIVPSFNRAHLLPLTLPSYLQPEVKELILIDDCSVDNTEAVVKELQQKYPQIRYFKNAVNSKQGFSKNVGLEHATGDYIYFGDDDSLIIKDTIKILLETLQNYNADVVSARTLFAGNYFTNINELDKFVKWMGKKRVAKDEKEICDLKNMKFNFGLNFYKPINIPVAAHPAAIVKTNVAKQFKYDVAYVGSAYREETDYWVQIALAGYKFMFNPKAAQVNLPPKMVKLTGARADGFEVWKESAIKNNKYFLDKNWAKICEKFSYKTRAEDLQKEFITNLKDGAFLRENKLKAFLKKLYFKIFV
jgi:glycosyltransferase involved in cell wall biosynthesis